MSTRYQLYLLFYIYCLFYFIFNFILWFFCFVRLLLSLLRLPWNRFLKNTDLRFCLLSNFPSLPLVLLHHNLQVCSIRSLFVSFVTCTYVCWKLGIVELVISSFWLIYLSLSANINTHETVWESLWKQFDFILFLVIEIVYTQALKC